MHFMLATSSRTTMLAILSILLTAFPLSFTLSHSEPMCQDPPPPASYIPNLSDCQHLVQVIFAASKLQDDEPILWSRHPSALVRNRKLPYTFAEPFASSDCEIIVDAIQEQSQDTFPTKLIGEKAEELVQKCMERGIEGAETLGAVAVGPALVLAVIVLRKVSNSGSGSGGVHGLNMVNATLLRPGNFSRISQSLVEDG